MSGVSGHLVRDDISCFARDDGDSASLRVAPTGTAVLTVRVLAGSGQVALQLDGALVLRVRGGRVLEDGQPGDAALGAHAEVDGRIVANVPARVSPLAAYRGGRTNRI